MTAKGKIGRAKQRLMSYIKLQLVSKPAHKFSKAIIKQFPKYSLNITLPEINTRIILKHENVYRHKGPYTPN